MNLPRDPEEDYPAETRSATFEELIDGWRREGAIPQWPEPIDGGSPDVAANVAADVVGPARPDGPAGGDGAAGDDDAADTGRAPEDDHYVPPEPPPLPRLGAPALVGLALLGLGLLLLVVPRWIGVPETLGIPLGLLALASGIGWLVLRLWPPAPPAADGEDDGEDDGAVI